MADNHSKESRHLNMSRIRSADTKPEKLVRSYLFSKGFRYRKNVNALPGCPDIVLPKYRTVIFVHGCFWHKHNCPRFVWPSSNKEYWTSKITKNVERDQKNVDRLSSLGWKVIIVWECQLKPKLYEDTLLQLVSEITKESFKNE